jgi:uncharacterized repeat protein (TIGR02543 family)
MKRIIYGLLVVLSFCFFVGCQGKTYEVSFDLNYETTQPAPATQKIKEGEKATEPLQPTREGYEFLGWFKEDAEERYDFGTPVTSTFTLYARWRELEEDEKVAYYLGGSFNNYDAADPDYKMTKDEDGKYSFTLELTDENRDHTYDGHYYKVTAGSWDADKCWGIDIYYIQPAPLSPTGAGLGSIWHWANGTLKVTFDPEEMLIIDELVIPEPIIEEIEPTVYGKFNGWAIEGENAFVLTDPDGDGIYTGMIEFEEAGTSDFKVVVSRKWYDDQWGQRWGAEEQYKPDGSPAGFGDAIEIDYEAGLYLFEFDSKTKETTYLKVEADVVYEFVHPRIYGKFNTWDMEGENAFVLTDSDGDGIYTGMIEFEAAGESDFTVVLSKKWYDDQWGQRWGAEEQYKPDGSPAGFGDAIEIDYEAGLYLFAFDSKTKETTCLKVEAGTIDAYAYPRIYGEFNGWDIDGENAFILSDPDGDGIYTGMIEFEAAGESDFSVVLSRKWYDDQWGKRWGAEEQYKPDGTPAGMGSTTKITYEAGLYLFTFDSETKETAYLKVEAGVVYEFAFPRVYGALNGWDMEGENALVLTDEDGDGVYTASFEFSEEGITDIWVVLSKKWYDDEWGKRWGAEDQYKLESDLAYEEGTYLFSFNAETKEIIVVKQ